MAALDRYLGHVGDAVDQASEFLLPEWDAEEFTALLGQAQDTAVGLDGWAPKHWKHLTSKAA
eukprot:1441366-Lingulodinium_polyedra.AAC.1